MLSFISFSASPLSSRTGSSTWPALWWRAAAFSGLALHAAFVFPRSSGPPQDGGREGLDLDEIKGNLLIMGLLIVARAFTFIYLTKRQRATSKKKGEALLASAVPCASGPPCWPATTTLDLSWHDASMDV